MIRGKGTLFVVLLLFAVCFLTFGAVTKLSLGTENDTRVMEIENLESRIPSLQTEITNPHAVGSALQEAEKQSCSEQLACIQAAVDGWNSGDWKKRIENETKLLELQLDERKFGVILEDDSALQDDLAFHQALLRWQAKPRDGMEDGISCVFSLVKNWMMYLLPLLAVFIAADLIAGERSSGSIKLLLQRKETRAVIYLRKYLLGLKWTAAAAGAAVVGAFLGGTVMNGPGSLNYPVLYGSDLVQTWKLFLLFLATVLLALAFYTALGLFLSNWFRSGSLASVASASAVSAVVFFGRKAVVTAHGGLWQFSPFECSDVYSAAFGKIEVPVTETMINPLTGRVTTYTERITAYTIPAALPLWASLLVLLAGTVLLLTAGAAVFRRKDLI